MNRNLMLLLALIGLPAAAQTVPATIVWQIPAWMPAKARAGLYKDPEEACATIAVFLGPDFANAQATYIKRHSHGCLLDEMTQNGRIIRALFHQNYILPRVICPSGYAVESSDLNRLDPRARCARK